MRIAIVGTGISGLVAAHRLHPEHEIVDKIVTQSSDSEFHCLTITLFYKHNAKA